MPVDLKISISILFVILSSIAVDAAPSRIENRCGWFNNPTPRNAWLNDKDGEWIIAIQGEYEANGNWNPSFDLDNERKFVRTGSSYGYGCICMKVESDLPTKKIRKVSSIKIKNLSDCRKDKNLKEPKSAD